MNPRAALGRLRRSGLWRPAAAAYLLRDVVPRPIDDLPSDDASLRGAAEWLATAQDATIDGGISGRYRLKGGWSSSYPETTGYAIPTLLRLADVLRDPDYRERASRCVEFLLSVQLPSGAFPALEIDDNRTEPSPFNSAQIIHGLHRWHAATGDSSALEAMMRAAHWICATQDDDGAWRQHSYQGLACTYSAHAACWLAEIAVDTAEPRFRACAERNLQWVLRYRDRETGWFDRCGFSAADHEARRAHTHTIAYTLWGVLRMSECLRVPEGLEAVRVAGERLLERLERSRTLAGVLNYRWQPQCSYVCLTGNAQLAVLWLRLADVTGDLRFVNAAFKAIDQVKRAQSLASGDAGIRGGVAGSSRAGGDYIAFAFPNWAAKFLVDALCAKREWGAREREAPSGPVTAPRDARLEPRVRAGTETETPTVAVYTTALSPTFARLAERWRARGFAPALVVVETGAASAVRRAVRAVRRRRDDSARICRRHGWRYQSASTVNSLTAISAVEQAAPLVSVNAGAGILRRGILALPSLGTLGAHMGILPFYRGMNVAEWAMLNGDSAGCSVFWVDEGIDTGAVIATRHVRIEGCRSIDDVRSRIDENQLALLDDTLRSIVDDRSRPSSREQEGQEGRQFFRMHADLRRIVEQRLHRSGDRDGCCVAQPP
jgi:folate-dependent phosphoribosylglycinamide formyltransferase PurN